MKAQIVKSLQTIVEMLKDRGIDVQVTPGQIEQFNPSCLIFNVNLGNIMVIFYLANKFKWTDIRDTFDQEAKSTQQKSLYILVVKDKINQNNMKSLMSKELPLQIFNIQELQFNISKHTLVPKHTKLPAEEIQPLIEKLAIKSKHQLPIILKSDPMSRYLDLKPGDVVKITRASQTAGEYVAYRCCV